MAGRWGEHNVEGLKWKSLKKGFLEQGWDGMAACIKRAPTDQLPVLIWPETTTGTVVKIHAL